MNCDRSINADGSVRFSAFLLLGLLVVFSPTLEGGTTHVAVMIIRLMILILAGFCLCIGLRQGAMMRPRLVLDRPVVAFIGLAFLSMMLSPNRHQSRQWFMVVSLYALLLYLIVIFVNRWKYVMWLLGVVTAMGLGESVLALVQYSVFGILRPGGTFFNPNFLAGYLAAIFILLLGLGVYATRRPKHDAERTTRHLHCVNDFGEFIAAYRISSKWIVLWGGILTLLLAGVVITGSRGGLLSLVAGATFVVIARYGLRGFALLALVVVGLLFIRNPLQSRIAAEHTINPVAYSRVHMWNQAVHLIVGNPLGRGLGLYQYIYPQFAFPVEGGIARYGKVAQTAHNEYLQLGVELGILGLTVFLWGLMRTVMEFNRVRRARLWRWQRGLVIGLGGMIATVLTHAAVDSNLHESAIAILLTLAIGLLFAVALLIDRPVDAWQRVTLRPRRTWFAAGVLILIVVSGVVVLKTGIAWVYFDAGSRAQQEGNLVKAIENYQAAVRLDSDKALYHSSLAAVHFRTFQQTLQESSAQAALDELSQAIRHNALDGRLRGIQGHVYGTLARTIAFHAAAASRRQEFIRRAIQSYEEARELEPFSPFHRLELGRLYWSVGKRQRAIQEVLRAEQLEPNFLPAREWLARAYVASGSTTDRELAIREVSEILERQRRYEAVPKDTLESAYLSVDVLKLKTELDRASGPIS